MITLEKLTNELQINNIDEVYGGWSWTTAGGSSGSDDRYHISFWGIVSYSLHHTWT